MKRLNDEPKEFIRTAKPRVVNNDINAKIHNAKNINDLLDIYNRDKLNLNHSNVTTMIVKFTEISKDKRDHYFVDLLIPKIQYRINYFNHQNVIDILRSFKRLCIYDFQTFKILANKIVGRIQNFNFKEITEILQIYSKFNILNVELFQVSAQEIIDRIDTISNLEIAPILYAYASLNIKNKDLYKILSKRIHDQINDFSHDDIIKILWSFITLNIFQENIYESLINILYINPVLDLDKLRQLYYVYLYCRYEIKSDILTYILEHFDFTLILDSDIDTKSSKTHLNCADHLKSLGIKLYNEVSINGLICDICIPDSQIIIEINGKTHYICETNELLGKSLLKNRLLTAMGWKVVTIPCLEWNKLNTRNERDSYLLRKLL